MADVILLLRLGDALFEVRPKFRFFSEDTLPEARFEHVTFTHGGVLPSTHFRRRARRWPGANSYPIHTVADAVMNGRELSEPFYEFFRFGGRMFDLVNLGLQLFGTRVSSPPAFFVPSRASLRSAYFSQDSS